MALVKCLHETVILYIKVPLTMNNEEYTYTISHIKNNWRVYSFFFFFLIIIQISQMTITCNFIANKPYVMLTKEQSNKVNYPL